VRPSGGGSPSSYLRISCCEARSSSWPYGGVYHSARRSAVIGPPPIAAWSGAESIHRQKAGASTNDRNLRIAEANFTAPKSSAVIFFCTCRAVCRAFSTLERHLSSSGTDAASAAVCRWVSAPAGAVREALDHRVRHGPAGRQRQPRLRSYGSRSGPQFGRRVLGSAVIRARPRDPQLD